MKKTYLVQKVYLLLSNKRIPKQDRIRLQNSFISSFYEILKVCFDILITEKDLKEYKHEVDEKQNSKLYTAQFITKILENRKTYDYINYFCYNFIRIVKEKYY